MSATTLGMLVLLSVGANAAEPKPLERELLSVGKEVIEYCRSNNYNNIGVLKFQITKDGKNLSDNVGVLNMLLARRLEVALVLNQQKRQKDPIGIIDNASAVAQRTKGANHLTKEGRSKFFDASYPLAWGQMNVRADAFITGLAKISDDLKTLEIQLLLFDKAGKWQPLLKEFSAAVQPEQLIEIGESFNSRGLFDDGDLEHQKKEKVIHYAELVRNQKKEGNNAPVNPAGDAKAPVTLEVRYDGHVVPVEIRGGKAYVPEPRQGQKVAFWLRRDLSPDRFGIVLKVNGENTIERQRLPDLQCRFWVLEPNGGPLVIDGYLKANNREKEEFRVLSARESQAREIDYGADVGTITLTVFKEWKGKRKTPDYDAEQKEARVVSKGALETKPQDGEPLKPDSLGALTARLFESSSRGIIAEGPTKPGAVNLVKFEADPLPVMCLTVIYYLPTNLPK